MLSRYKEVAETILSLHESRDDRVVRRAVVELVPRLAAFSPRRFCESYLAPLGGDSARLHPRPALGTRRRVRRRRDLALALAEDDDDSDDDETETREATTRRRAERARARGQGGGQSGQSGFGFAASAASSVSRRSSDGGNLSLADSAASGHAGQGSSQGAQGHHQGSQGSQQGQQNARPRRSGSLAEKTWSGPSQTNPEPRARGGCGPPRGEPPAPGGGGARAVPPRDRERDSRDVRRERESLPGKRRWFVLRRRRVRRGRPRVQPEPRRGRRAGGDGKNRTAAGRSGSSFLEPGAAEALLCVGALASSCGELWEPHARALLPALFAPGLTAPLVDALDAVPVALTATLPMIQRRLIETISGIHGPDPPRACGRGRAGWDRARRGRDAPRGVLLVRVRRRRGRVRPELPLPRRRRRFRRRRFRRRVDARLQQRPPPRRAAEIADAQHDRGFRPGGRRHAPARRQRHLRPLGLGRRRGGVLCVGFFPRLRAERRGVGGRLARREDSPAAPRPARQQRGRPPGRRRRVRVVRDAAGDPAPGRDLRRPG